MKYIAGEDRFQIAFLPDCIDDYVSEDNPVRVIDAFVNQLDMDKLGFIRAIPNNTGRPSYDPRDLLKLYIYGYFNKVRSSRKLMKECARNLEVMFLLGKLTPDFRTIADFRKDNPKALKSVFKAFVKVCLKLNLYQRELFAIDGSKFRAQNSKSNCYNKIVLEKKLKNIENNISNYLNHLNKEDKNEIAEEVSPKKINEAIKNLKERKDKYIEYLNELEETGEKQILTTDPEARRMHSKDGFHCCYNVQTAIDKGSHLIADYMVTNRNNDIGLLNDVSQGVKKNLDIQTVEVVADKGYESKEDILNCVMNGVIPNVALKFDKKERLFSIEYEDADITEEIKASTKSEDIQKCIKAGILPNCYENSPIEIEIQNQSVLSCFILNEDGTVTCPIGHKLPRVKMRGKSTIYGSKEACRQCPNKCTGGKTHKTVSFGPDTKFVPVVFVN
ncbi:MAG: transposase [Firmicutes bacterium]|nr:transposase [Bacillota bacterium]